MAHSIVVTGATGKQGKGVVKALVKQQKLSQSDITIYAITRNPNCEIAKSLLSESDRVQLSQGDFSAPEIIIKNIPSKSKASWSLFMISNPGKNEIKESNSLIDHAISNGVSHIVYSSVCRGSTNNGNNPSKVDHWQTKHIIEAHLREACSRASSLITFTILRPVFLLDNLSIPGFFGQFSATLWADIVSPRPLKVIDPSDVGVVASAALLDSSSSLYKRNAELTLCGDELSFEQANEIFKKKVAYPMPMTSKWIVKLLLFLMRDFGRMAYSLRDDGFGAPVGSGSCGINLSDFGTWVDNSRFVPKTSHTDAVA